MISNRRNEKKLHSYGLMIIEIHHFERSSFIFLYFLSTRISSSLLNLIELPQKINLLYTVQVNYQYNPDCTEIEEQSTELNFFRYTSVSDLTYMMRRTQHSLVKFEKSLVSERRSKELTTYLKLYSREQLRD